MNFKRTSRCRGTFSHEPDRCVIVFRTVMSALLPAFLMVCSTPRLQSFWATDSIIVDGNIVEWQNRVNYRDDRNTAIGFMNDTSSLYLCIMSFDRELIMQMMHGGFAVRFSHRERKNTHTGIRFLADKRPKVFPGKMDREFVGDTALQQEDEAFQRVELLGPAAGQSITTTVKVAESYGIHYKTGAGREKFVFELIVPLHKDSADFFPIGIDKDSVIDLVIESEAPEFTGMRGSPGGEPGGGGGPQGDGGGSPGGGFGGGGGMGFPGGGGGPPGAGMGGRGGGPPGGMANPEPIKMKMRVLLSRGPAK